MLLKLLLFFVIAYAYAEQCTTPNNEIAECRSLYTCPVLISALVTQQPISIEFVRQSTCGRNETDPLVCCGSVAHFAVPKVTTDASAPKLQLLPGRTYCGYQHSDEYFRKDSRKAEINEFPWLALLLYIDKKGQPKPNIRCGGSLISARYILTSAHCVQDAKEHGYSLTAVRLGDFNVKNSTDCVDTTGFEECSNPVEEFGVEKAITHPRYTNNHGKAENDIALLRLNGTVTYSDYIRPICLPFPGTTFAQVGDVLYTSGWGRINNTIQYAEVKKKVQTRLISHEDCSKTYNWNFTDNQFCTKEVEQNAEYSCVGDSGGPVMFSSHRAQWHQEGISSYSVTLCGGSHPDVNTRVKNYLDWIQDSVEP